MPNKTKQPKTKQPTEAQLAASAAHTERERVARLARTEQFKQGVMWLFVNHLKRLRALPRPEVERIAVAASDISENNPLHMVTNRFGIEGYADAKTLTGAGVTAVLLAGLYVLQGENDASCGGLLGDWPDIPAFARLAANGGENGSR